MRCGGIEVGLERKQDRLCSISDQLPKQVLGEVAEVADLRWSFCKHLRRRPFQADLKASLQYWGRSAIERRARSEEMRINPDPSKLLGRGTRASPKVSS